MRSPVIEAVNRARQAEIAAMTPSERITLLERLSAEGLEQFMKTHGLDRSAAVARIRATRRLGRRRSRSAEGDAS